MIVGLIASRHDFNEILQLYPYLEKEDIEQALRFAAGDRMKLSYPLPEQENSGGHEVAA
jgi:uncharacterized protein (DUF433 family)